MESEYIIHAYVKNQVSLYSVKGESNSRTFIFNIIERSGTVAPTSNAVPVDLMLDLTGYTVVLRIAGTNIQTSGTVITALSGKVSFTLPASFTAESGTYQCEIVLTKNDEQLSIIGITLTVAYPQVKIIRTDPEEYGSSKNIAFVIPRGTPYVLEFNIKNFREWMQATKGKWWWDRLKNGDKVLFGIKKHPDDSEYIYTRIVEVHWGYAKNEYGNIVGVELGEMTSHGGVRITLSESDTDIEPGIYYYSIAALVSEKKSNRPNNYEYKDPCFVEITPPIPFRIRPMMIALTDMCAEYARLIAETEKKITALRAKAQTQAIEEEIQSLTRLKWDYQAAMRKIQNKIDGGAT